jgi:hypothetical protein
LRRIPGERNPAPGVPLNVQSRTRRFQCGSDTMDGLIYLVGLIVIILAVLSFFGLR